MLNTQLEVARKLVPQFDSIGFVRGQVSRLAEDVYAWTHPNIGIVSWSLADSEGACIMLILKHAQELK